MSPGTLATTWLAASLATATAWTLTARAIKHATRHHSCPCWDHR